MQRMCYRVGASPCQPTKLEAACAEAACIPALAQSGVNWKVTGDARPNSEATK